MGISFVACHSSFDLHPLDWPTTIVFHFWKELNKEMCWIKLMAELTRSWEKKAWFELDSSLWLCDGPAHCFSLGEGAWFTAKNLLKSPVDLKKKNLLVISWWFYQTVNVLKMPRSRSVFSFRNSQGKLGVHNPLTPGKYTIYFTFSSTRKTWLNSALNIPFVTRFPSSEYDPFLMC